jgi:hypothetical protein
MPVFLPEADDLLDLGDASQASLEVDCASMPPLRQGEEEEFHHCLHGFTSSRVQVLQLLSGGV